MDNQKFIMTDSNLFELIIDQEKRLQNDCDVNTKLIMTGYEKYLRHLIHNRANEVVLRASVIGSINYSHRASLKMRLSTEGDTHYNNAKFERDVGIIYKEMAMDYLRVFFPKN